MKSGNGVYTETRGLDTSRNRQLSYPQLQLAFKPQLNKLPLELTTSSSSHLHKRITTHKDIYGDKLTDKPDIRYETRFHALVYTIAPNGPHMSHLGSHEASESSCLNGTLHAGAGTFRNDPCLPRSSSSRKIVTAYPEACNRADVIRSTSMTGTLQRRSTLGFGIRLEDIPTARKISLGM